MALEITPAAIPEVLIIKPDVFRDSRGSFMEIYHRLKYGRLGLAGQFVQDNHSRSDRGVLRGLHYQLNFPQAKLVTVLRGKIFDVAVDIRRGSPTFGRWIGEELSDENNHQMFIPEGFAHGFCVLSDTADFIYKCTDFYHPEDDRGILWSDDSISISWPFSDPLISEKDSRLSPLRSIPAEFLPVYKP